MGGQIRRGWFWRFWGAPIFRPEVPNPLKIGIWGPLDWSLGRPKNAKTFHDGSDPPFVALWRAQAQAQARTKRNQGYGWVTWLRVLAGASSRRILGSYFLCTINTKLFAIQKKILRGINFVKITKIIFQRWSRMLRIWPLLFGFCAISTPQRIPEKLQKENTKKNGRGINL